jgi:riboflavin kinase/FMN adenylyltransferase
MKVFAGLEAVDPPFAVSSVAIGSFDGVHLGHQAIIRAAVADARRHNRPALVFTFDRHPAELLRPELAPAMLCTPAQREALIAAQGADGLIIARFDYELSELSPNAFVQRILKDLLGARAIVEGANFYFGKGRAGDLAYLQAAQAQFDFTLHFLAPVLVGGIPASSTRVRECLAVGDIAEAEALLGHPFLLAGTIVSGQRLGRQLGYPTANLAPTYRQAVPSDGIYAVYAHLDDGRVLGGACSIGNRPTVEGAGRCIETYLFNLNQAMLNEGSFNEDIYGRHMELQFVQRLRLEAKFDSLDDLIVQMGRDVEQAKRILSDASP